VTDSGILEEMIEVKDDSQTLEFVIIVLVELLDHLNHGYAVVLLDLLQIRLHFLAG